VFVANAVVTALFGLAALLPFLPACAAALAVGFIAQGNFSNLASGLLAVATPRYAGTTMALYSCIGFGGGFAGTVLFGFKLDRFGGPDQLGAWVASFGISGIVCLLGAGGMALLPRDVGRRAYSAAAKVAKAIPEPMKWSKWAERDQLEAHEMGLAEWQFLAACHGQRGAR
jgi:MFS family permease